MRVLEARYRGHCPACQKPIMVGDKIAVDPVRGIKAHHETCMPSAEQIANSAALMQRVQQLAAWERANPKPELPPIKGAPELNLEDAITDEERRMARGRFEDAAAAWLRKHAEIEQAYELLMDEWKQRRADFEQRLQCTKK